MKNHAGFSKSGTLLRRIGFIGESHIGCPCGTLYLLPAKECRNQLACQFSMSQVVSWGGEGGVLNTNFDGVLGWGSWIQTRCWSVSHQKTGPMSD